jgi:hypothetical protein
LYREAGVLTPAIHPGLAEKMNSKDPLFNPATRRRRAKDLYRLTITDTDVTRIAAPYERQTHLSVQDVYDAFSTGTCVIAKH